jgi:DNA polymerase-1
VLVKADYSQIELRIAAKVTGDGSMCAAYANASDLHTRTAQWMTGKQEVTKAERGLAKPVNFGLIYGQGVATLRKKAKVDYGRDLSEEQAREFRDRFFKEYPGVEHWHNKLKGDCWRGVPAVFTLGGRRITIAKEDKHDWYGKRANFIIQGTGGDGIKIALALLWERRHEVPGAFPVLAVHDEVVVECDAVQVDVVSAWLKKAMLDAMEPLIAPVPVEVEVTIGRNWAGDPLQEPRPADFSSVNIAKEETPAPATEASTPDWVGHHLTNGSAPFA